MTEQTFRSPNFFEREIDLSAPVVAGPTGVPGGVIGTANKGPAFVPVTVGNFNDFIEKFGNLDPKKFGPYAVNEFLKHKGALTYLRVLGAGANQEDADILDTQLTGRVKGAGMLLTGTTSPTGNGTTGVVQFLVAKHNATVNELNFGSFSYNDSIDNANAAKLVRGVFMTPETSRIMVYDSEGSFANNLDDVADVDSVGEFTLVISSSLGSDFANDGAPGVKSFKVSLNS
jgi:hypothetical protein